MTFQELLARMDQYVNRNDPDYVQNREELLRAGHRWLERKYLGKEAMYQHFQLSEPLALGVGTLPLPGCYRHSAELKVYLLPDRLPLQKILPRFLREPFLQDGLEYNLKDPMLGTPRFYAVQGNTLALRPFPDKPVDVEIVGTGWSEEMVDLQDETLLTQDAPDAVIYAGCRETWLFLGDEPQSKYWEEQAARAISEWAADRIREELPPVLHMEVPG